MTAGPLTAGPLTRQLPRRRVLQLAAGLPLAVAVRPRPKRPTWPGLQLFPSTTLHPGA